MWELEAERNEVVLTGRSLLDKSSEGWLRQHLKEQRQLKRTLRRKDDRAESSPLYRCIEPHEYDRKG